MLCRDEIQGYPLPKIAEVDSKIRSDNVRTFLRLTVVCPYNHEHVNE